MEKKLCAEINSEQATTEMIRQKDKTTLRKLALDAVMQEVFTSTMIAENEHARILERIFLPLLVLTEKQVDAIKKYQPVMFYEYYDRALQRLSGNGYPIFPSVRMLNQNEFDMYKMCVSQYQKALDQVTTALAGGETS